MAVKKPYINFVSYNAAGATVGIGASISDFSYTEQPGFGRSHCEFSLHPGAGFIPTTGDALEIQVKYEGDAEGNHMTTGTHIVDSVFFDYARHVFNIGMSAYDFNSGALSQEMQGSLAYDDASVRAIVSTQAGQLQMTVDNINSITGVRAGFWFLDEANSRVVYRFQGGKTRAEVLEKIAAEYGYFLRVKAGVIFFYDYLDFEIAIPSMYLSLSNFTADSTCQHQRSADGMYSGVRVWYAVDDTPIDNPETRVEVLPIPGSPVSNRIFDKVSDGLLFNQDAAARYAYGASKVVNKNQELIIATAPGDYRYVLGTVVQLLGSNLSNPSSGVILDVDGNYFIRKCVHTLRSQDSWRTSLELQRIFRT